MLSPVERKKQAFAFCSKIVCPYDGLPLFLFALARQCGQILSLTRGREQSGAGRQRMRPASQSLFALSFRSLKVRRREEAASTKRKKKKKTATAA